MDLIDLADKASNWSPPARPGAAECVGAVVSNGRLFYTAQASGLQACEVYGDEATQIRASWE